MERRRGGRKKRRITCELRLGERPQRGIVLDLSPGGLFVQTDASPAPGARIELALRDTDGREAVVAVRVARKRQVPRHLRSVAPAGLGLEIDGPSEAYQAFLEPSAGKPDPPAAAPCFQVRIKQVSGPRSKTLRIHAATAEDARQKALNGEGAGWAVLDVQETE